MKQNITAVNKKFRSYINSYLHWRSSFTFDKISYQMSVIQCICTLSFWSSGFEAVTLSLWQLGHDPFVETGFRFVVKLVSVSRGKWIIQFWLDHFPWQQKVNNMDDQRQYILVYSNQQTHMAWYNPYFDIIYSRQANLPGTITILMQLILLSTFS